MSDISYPFLWDSDRLTDLLLSISIRFLSKEYNRYDCNQLGIINRQSKKLDIIPTDER